MLVVTAAGNIGKDAQVRKAGQSDVCSFSVATERKDRGEKKTIWIDCSIWGARGVALAQYLVKGTKVAIAGELSTREHEGKTYLQCRVDQVTLLGGGKRSDEPPEPRPGPANNGRGGDDEIPFLFNVSSEGTERWWRF